MNVKAMRLHGANDLRLSEFAFPPVGDTDIMIEVMSDSVCMSSYKAAIQGPAHKRVPANIATNPVIVGHEFCGTIVEIGSKWQGKYQLGQRVTIQTAANPNTMDAPGYSFEFCGGASTHAIVPGLLVELGAILPYSGEAFFFGSLAEPMSCIVGAFHAQYHTKQGSYEHHMGIKPGGNLAILAGAGPMGMGSIDYACNGPIKPALVVVTDIDQARLDRAKQIYTPEAAAKNGVKLVYVNTASAQDAVASLMALSSGKGYDDVFVMAPVKSVVEQGDAILGHDGCLNFFAGPTDTSFSAPFNFYNVHYASTHIVGTSGGNTDDMVESLELMASGAINPAGMITHIGGLDSAPQTTLNLPKIPGGKKLIYTHLEMPLVAIDDFAEMGKSDPLFAKLNTLVQAHNGLWNAEAEKYLFENAKKI